MKKIISILLAALLMFSLLLTACKAPEVNIGEDGVPLANNADSRNKQGDYIASQEILDELYKEHLALRDLPANLTSAQIDYMLLVQVYIAFVMVRLLERSSAVRLHFQLFSFTIPHTM